MVDIKGKTFFALLLIGIIVGLMWKGMHQPLDELEEDFKPSKEELQNLEEAREMWETWKKCV